MDEDKPLADQPPEVQSQVIQRMLEASVGESNRVKTAQGYLVAYIARSELWRFHPDGYPNMRAYLLAAGLNKSEASILASIGEIVIPYCDSRGIEIDTFLTTEQWPKLREASAALRAAVLEDNEERVRGILNDVRNYHSRDAVREKYRQRVRQAVGHATTMRLPNGKVLLVAMLDDDAAAETVIGRLAGLLSWDLTVSCSNGGGLRIYGTDKEVQR